MNRDIKGYVESFRIRELQECLTQLQLPTKGRKAELQTRLFAYLTESFPTMARGEGPPGELWRFEAANRIVVNTYNKMKGTNIPVPGAPAQRPQQAGQPPQQHPGHALNGMLGPHPAGVRPPNSAGLVPPNGVVGTSNPAALRATMPAGPHSPNVEIIPTGGRRSGGSGQSSGGGVNGRVAVASGRLGRNNTQIRCLCDVNLERGSMIQCEGELCGVWQHTACVSISPSQNPEHFYCEMCRMAWADPFWEITNGRIMPPAKLSFGGAIRGPGGVTERQHIVDRTFHLPHAKVDEQRNPDNQLQAVCLLLGDAVPFRFHWPQNVELHVNNRAYKPYGRPINQKIGNNVRDEPVDLRPLVFAGRNRLRLVTRDDRPFCVVVISVRRRSMQAVKGLMAPEESLEAALQRVESQVGGDDDLQISSTVISLRCPLSGSRVVNPARFAGVNGLVAFDLETFLSMAERSRKWQCPHSMKHTHVQQLQRDTFIAHILDKLKDLPDVMDVEVSPAGNWRPASGSYPWSKVTDPLPAPLPVTSRVKPEPREGEGGLESSNSDEELSEAEEIRRAAHAYASTSNRPAQQDVIVLDDSSDEDVPPPPPKRPNLGAHAIGMNARLPHAANGISQRPYQGAASGSTTSSGDAGPSQCHMNGLVATAHRMQQPNADQGAQHGRNGLNIRLPSRPQVGQPSRMASEAARHSLPGGTAGRQLPDPPPPFPSSSQPAASRGYPPLSHLMNGHPPHSPAAYSGGSRPGASQGSAGGQQRGLSFYDAASKPMGSHGYPAASPAGRPVQMPNGASAGSRMWGASFSMPGDQRSAGPSASQAQQAGADPYQVRHQPGNSPQYMRPITQEHVPPPPPPLPPSSPPPLPWDEADNLSAEDAAFMGALLGDGLGLLPEQQQPPPPRRVQQLQPGPNAQAPNSHVSLSSGGSWQRTPSLNTAGSGGSWQKTASVPSTGQRTLTSNPNPVIDLDSD